MITPVGLPPSILPPSARGARLRFARLAGLAALALAGLAACAAPAPTTPPPASPAATPPPAAVSSLPPLHDRRPRGVDRERLLAAIADMDARRFDASIRALEDLHARHPDNAIVIHELSLAYRLSKQPQKAIALLMPLRERISVETLANLASALDEAGKSADAVALLRDAIIRHPRSGLLCSELGTTLNRIGDVETAVKMYERGINVEPAFAASYHNLARLLSKSRARGLALIHGETFRLLEPGSRRSREMASVLVGVVTEGVKVEKTGGKSVCKVSLAPDIVATPGQPLRMPFVNAFEIAFGKRLCEVRGPKADLASLHKARRAFLQDTRKAGMLYAWNSVPLLRWLRELDAAGHLEAYDHWLFGPALEDEATDWIQSHRGAMDAMAQYVAHHPLFPKRVEEPKGTLRSASLAGAAGEGG